jgi:hypothetical protein
MAEEKGQVLSATKPRNEGDSVEKVHLGAGKEDTIQKNDNKK